MPNCGVAIVKVSVEETRRVARSHGQERMSGDWLIEEPPYQLEEC
jgi:hypothetical protein